VSTLTPLPAMTLPAGTGGGVPARADARAGRPVHVEHIPARPGREVPWPQWAPAEVVSALQAQGIRAPWSHQALAADHAQAGRNVIISTAAASGKSLGYLLPALTSVLAGDTVLYVTPTKALAADQLASIRSLGLPGIQAASFDGDSTYAERSWARSHARYLLTTPDMLHRALLPGHARWSGFFSRLRYVIIDECHGYRGVFGSHVAHVLRRLRRVVAHHASPDGLPRPVFVLASATVGAPGVCARLLTGLDAEEVTEDGSPRGPLAFALWEPPLTDARGETGARLRRTATAQTADLLGRLVSQNVQTLAFIRSRRGAEAVALAARRSLDAHGADRAAGSGAATGAAGAKVAAYRSGYLPEDRRRLEAALSDGRLVGLATTTALELGINITGLDAVLIAGWPGTWASLWQQAGRAGRAGRSAAAVLIARDDPLDTYLVRHPEILLRHPVEATVLDPGNPYVLAPHLCAAAAERALTEQDLEIFGPAARTVIDELTRAGRLRRRPAGWYSMRRDAAAAAGLRGAGLAPVRVVEQDTGRLVGTVDEPSAHLIVHEGAIYVHQGDSYLVGTLDLDDRVALVEPCEPGYTTTARDVTEVEIRAELRQLRWGQAQVRFGDVQVTRQVVSFTRRRADTGASLGDTPLDLPPRRLLTRAVWWTISEDQADALAAAGIDLGGAAHAAEHASIGLLPLFATCDRWDIGGVSAASHPATGKLTVLVYDGHDGGAGFAERGFQAAADWLLATRQAIAGCDCEAGCPSCVQSPKCGNANHPLSKRGAVALLDLLLAGRSAATTRAEGEHHGGRKCTCTSRPEAGLWGQRPSIGLPQMPARLFGKQNCGPAASRSSDTVANTSTFDAKPSVHVQIRRPWRSRAR
jgi:DEAD/DEAH box helicase domain-containing protein